MRRLLFAGICLVLSGYAHAQQKFSGLPIVTPLAGNTVIGVQDGKDVQYYVSQFGVGGLSPITGTSNAGDILIANSAGQIVDVASIANLVVAVPIPSNPSNTTPTLPGGPLGSNSLAIENGTLNVWNARTYGWGGSATAACIIANLPYPGGSSGGGKVWQQNNNCPVTGGVGKPSTGASGYATYTSRDSVGLVVFNYGAGALFGSLAGTFTSTTFVPTTPLNSTQRGNLRVGMPIDTNDSPTPYSGVISGWDAVGGTYVTVQDWYLDGTTTPGTPSGTAATISNITKLFGTNFVTDRILDFDRAAGDSSRE